MLSKKISNDLKKSSWIRLMFEEGNKLAAKYGRENVYDFSLGNPTDEPPKGVKDAILATATMEAANKHGYMSNAGYARVRQRIADYINDTKGSKLTDNHVIMTCGAAGALNVSLKALLDPGDEVIVFSPYFVEYLFYIENHGGKAVIIPANTENFQPDPEVFEKYVTAKTKAVIINNPNNPTGVVYSEVTLTQLNEVIEKKEKQFGSEIYILSDEPYDRIVYDDAKVPSVFKCFKNSIIVNSFSKSHSLPGERIGYIAINDRTEDADTLSNGMAFCNRILGFVNAPAFMQRVVSDAVYETIDMEGYKLKRDLLYDKLISLGFKCIKPQGAFYLFPKALIEDDVEFARRAQKYNILVVPGTGFGCPGYCRIAYCCSIETIEKSLPAFEKLAQEFRE